MNCGVGVDAERSVSTTCRGPRTRCEGAPHRPWPREENTMRSTELSWDEQARADAGRLWAGGVVTAIVAAGVALVAVMVSHKLLHATLLNPDGSAETADDA